GLGLGATAGALLILTGLRPESAGTVLPVAMIGVVAFCLLGPYAFLPGAFALDFGGKQAGAAASGLVDGTGYLGGVLAGTVMARGAGVLLAGGGVGTAPPARRARGACRAPPLPAGGRLPATAAAPPAH